METVNQDNTQVLEDTQTEPRVFTQDELNTIIEERLKRERAKYADYDTFKEKAGRLDQLEEANKTELQKATEQGEAYRKELEALKAANAIRDARAAVSDETGVPASVLTGETEEECRAQAQAILDFAGKQSRYPAVRDAGESKATVKRSTREQFKEWANQVF